MGNRLHVAKRYDVVWGSTQNFNWKSVEFHAFLDSIGVEICGTDRTSDLCPWDFEISKEDWIKGIERLKGFENLSEEQQNEINDALNSLNVTLPKMIEIMETYLQESDQEWEYLEFAFF